MAQYVKVERRPAAGYAVVTVAKEPVNSFDLALWVAVHDALRGLEADPSMRGVVLASGLARDVFTAGNDLRELYAPLTSAARYAEFWAAQSGLLCGLYESRLATLAAIRGACPAGGCGIALACDARLMTRNGSMGLNEVALGIPVPKYWAKLMARTIGHAAAERLVLSGSMVDADAALRLGLVDELFDDGAALLARAEAVMEDMVALPPPPARAATKASLRAEFCAEWRQYYTTLEAEYGWRAISAPAAVAAMAGVLKRLSGKGKKKAKL